MTKKKEPLSFLVDKAMLVRVPFNYHFEKAYYPECDRYGQAAHIVLDEDFERPRRSDFKGYRRIIPAGDPLCTGDVTNTYIPIKNLREFHPSREYVNICKNCMMQLLLCSKICIDNTLF